MPLLPVNGSRGGVQLQQPFTTNAVVTLSGRSVDHSTLSTPNRRGASALPWDGNEDGKPGGVCFIGLSLSDQLDTVNTLTRYCIIVGVAIVILGALLATLMTQRTLSPLKRIEEDRREDRRWRPHTTRAPGAGEHGGRFAVGLAQRHAHPNRAELPRAGGDHGEDESDSSPMPAMNFARPRGDPRVCGAIQDAA